jgi:hypothetical protein
MIYALGVWIGGLILLFPVAVVGLAWARRKAFYRNSTTKHGQKILYLVALIAASVSTLAYLGYWGWRICQLYQITLPFTVLLTLERSVRICRILSATAIICFLIGRGPYRILLALATLWVLLQLWRGGIIHWA